ncbi:MAG: AAA domain-containing protein [Tepidisphaerales bacterium]
MSLLNFLAVEPRSRAGVIQSQAWDALRPFERYLFRVRENARERQKRQRFAFDVVRPAWLYRLRPVDTLLLVSAQEPNWWLLEGWPSGAPLNLTRKIHHPSKQEYLTVDSARATPDGLWIETRSQTLEDGDVVEWYGHTCTVRRPSPVRPKLVTTVEGEQLRVRWWETSPRGELLCVEGSFDASRVVVDGSQRTCEVLDVWEMCKSARDSSGLDVRVEGPRLRREQPLQAKSLETPQGVRLDVEPMSVRRRRGHCVQLKLPDDFPVESVEIDPRAELCEGEEVRELWTEPDSKRAARLHIVEIDRDRYQVYLKEPPPQGTKYLYAPLDTRAIEIQKRAVQQLRYSPLPAHRGLLRLCEHPNKAHWADPERLDEPIWELLTDESIDGVLEQRKFVVKSLATRDVAVLQGPPGSGKTTAICELVLQALKRGERVLMCATTHVAIDNALEKLLDARPDLVEAVRIGLEERVDEKVRRVQLDRRIEALRASWRAHGIFADLPEEERWEAAQSLVVTSANLTCATTAGILSHPQLRSRRYAGEDRPLTTYVPWDLLIIDEASKTTLTEFIVPAMLARKHIIVGDVQQLPPFVNIQDLEAAVAYVANDRNERLLSDAQQRARLIFWRLTRKALSNAGGRWLVVERPDVLDRLEEEIANELRKRNGWRRDIAVRVTSSQKEGLFHRVTATAINDGQPAALHMAAADWVLVDTAVWPDVEACVPADVVMATGPADTASAWAFRHSCLSRSIKLKNPELEREQRLETLDHLGRNEREFLSRSTWAYEVAWRLKRLHELRYSAEDRGRERYRKDLEALVPEQRDGEPLREAINDQRDIGLPSVIEVLQEGIGERQGRTNYLGTGLKESKKVFGERFVCLTYQHRMHPDISDYPRKVIYEQLASQKALQDANTIACRDQIIGWDFAPALPGRRAWRDAVGREEQGVNHAEVKKMNVYLREFIHWAERKGPPAGRKAQAGRAQPVWEVACLCFYIRQEEAIAAMVRELTGSDARHCFLYPDEERPLIEFRCGTVDRFQGREADLVLLSMRNTQRIGFLDSPNRINVAVTRARQQLIIFGNYNFFREGKRVPFELKELARMTPCVRGEVGSAL